MAGVSRRNEVLFALALFSIALAIPAASETDREGAAETADTWREPPVLQTPTFGTEVWAGPEGTVLFDNGPLINCVGCGVGGADESVLQNLSLGMNVFGFGHQVLNNNRVADDFTVPAGQVWDIETATFFAYQSFAGNTSTITGVNLRIWDGVPGEAGSMLVFEGSNLFDTAWTGIYRVLEDTSGTNTDRAIMANRVDIGVSLSEGTYWLDWQTDGTAPSGPWAPPITINGEVVTGNAIQSQDGGEWIELLDSVPGTEQGLPFILSREGASLCVGPFVAFGLEHCTTGNAVLSLNVDGSLAVEGIGASGQDGVLIDLSTCETCGTGNPVEFDYTSEEEILDNGWLEFACSTVNGSNLEEIRMTRLADGTLEVSVGYAAAKDGDMVLVEAFLDGALVKSALTPLLPPLGGVIQRVPIVREVDDALPQAVKRTHRKSDRTKPNGERISRKDWKNGGAPNVIFSVDGEVVVADEVGVEFVHTESLGDWTDVTLTGANVDGLIISNEYLLREFPSLEASLTGSCPGSITLTASGAPANSSLAVIFSRALGTDSLQGGPCAGTQTELSDAAVLSFVPTDGSGNIALTTLAPASLCGAFIQLVDGTSCAISPAIQIP